MRTRTLGVGFDTRNGAHGEESYPVPTVSPDLFGLDGPEEIAREKLAQGRFSLWFEQEKKAAADQSNSEWAFRFIAMTRPECRTSQILSWHMGSVESLTLPQLAQKYGVTKQAIQQDAQRRFKDLQMRPTRYMRQANAKLKMRLRNFRKNAIPPEFCPLP